MWGSGTRDHHIAKAWQFLHINVFCGLEMSTSFLHLTVFATETEIGLCLDSLQGLQLSVDCFMVFMASEYIYIPNSSFTTCRLRVCGPETYPWDNIDEFSRPAVIRLSIKWFGMLSNIFGARDKSRLTVHNCETLLRAPAGFWILYSSLWKCCVSPLVIDRGNIMWKKNWASQAVN